MDLTSLLLAGAAAGTAAGLLGIGGGVIIVPVLSMVFAAEGVGADVLIKVAVGTSLATIAVTAVSSILAHHRRGAVRWPLVRTMTPGVVLGSLLGACRCRWHGVRSRPRTACRGAPPCGWCRPGSA